MKRHAALLEDGTDMVNSGGNPSDRMDNTNKRQKQNDSLLEELDTTAAASIEKISSSEMDMDQVMTQVDERWNDTRRRKRTIGRMTQAPIGGLSAPDDESPSEAGIIEKLELFNFMCHSAFSLQFGPQTNFIIGRNGSGKSAVLTGISVALGAKATDTDRGNTLKNLIMHGKNVARAIVTLKNEGPEAYKTEEFGPKIIIERVLRNDRPHSLAIKNSAGKTISTTKKTVDKILEYFGITIANPMTFLTQTEAKTFLAHSSDKDKFNSFMEGTRLKESFDNIKVIEHNTNEIKDILSKNQDIYEEMKLKFKEAKKVWRSFKDSDEFSKRKELLIGKKLWVEFVENEKLYKKASVLLEKKSAEITSNETKKTAIEQEVIDMEKSKHHLESGELENYRMKYNQCKEEKNDSMNSINSAKEEIEEINRKMNAAKEKINEDQNLINKLSKDIEKEKKRIEGSSEENIERLKAFLKKQNEKITELTKERETVAADIEISKQELKDLEDKNRTVLIEVNNEIRNVEYKIREARQQEHSNRPESAFNPGMVKLIRDLRSQRFQNQIIGPLGLHIELKKEYQKWSSVLEHILQRTLTAFLVSNHRDAQLLSGRVKFFGTNSEITVRQNEIFDYSPLKPNSAYPSVLDVLKVEDESLRCFLVDSLKLHCTLLVTDRMEAQRELEKDIHQKISSVICLVDSNVLRLYQKNGALQSDPIYLNQKSNVRLRVEGDSLVLRLERDLAVLRKNKSEQEHRINEKSKTFTSGLKELQTKLSHIKHQFREISQSIEKTSNKLDKLHAGTSRFDSLMEEKESLEASRTLNIERLEPIQHEFNKAKKGVENQIKLYKSISDDYTNAKKLFETKRKEFDSYGSNIEYSKGNIRTLCNANLKLQNDVNKLEEYLSKTQELMHTLQTKAEEFCSFEAACITSDTTSESVENEIIGINKILAEIETRQGISKEQAEIDLLRANSHLKEIENKFNNTIALYNKLHRALENRLDNLLQTTYLTFQEVESVFISALKIRGFRGKIEFNVKQGTLTLKVATKETGPLRSVESFSGGEKSYGQIAFLFAIWGPMHSRVRGLDEFDVFMDNVNRRIALKLILNKVAETPKRQTIFITPLGIANIEGLDSKTVYIHEISPPERSNV